MRRLAFAVVAGTLLAGGCRDGTTVPADGAVFQVRVQADTFSVRAETDGAIAGLEARLRSGQEGVVLGTLAAGDGGFNDPWNWHLVPGSIEVPDVAVEVCDGTPRMVENDLEYWLETVGTYCPWSARVIRRLE